VKKTDDWFFAGMVAGAIGGWGIFLLNIVLLLMGIKHGTYWEAMGGLFYDKQLLKTTLAQIHGAIDATGVSAANGVVLAYVLLKTGRDYLYPKSVALSALGAYFLFLVVYPQTELGKNSAIVPWVALFGHTVFNGLLTGYILNKICSFNNKPKNENMSESSRRRIFLSPKFAMKKDKKEREVRLVKPKKL